MTSCLMRSAEQHPGTSALDPVAQVGDTVFTFKNPGALKQLNLLGSQVLEQAAIPAGHFLPEEAPEEITRHLLEFLG